jgi:predicted nucleic acid-binding protein
MSVLETSVLIDSVAGTKRSAGALRSMIERGERILIPSLVLYEWLRGPRVPAEIAAHEALFPSKYSAVFRSREGALSAQLYQITKTSPRQGNRFGDRGIAQSSATRTFEL